MKTTIGIVDDHKLFAKSLTLLIESFKDYEVIIEANNGIDLQRKLTGKQTLPEIIFLDINMPEMDGIATAKWLTENYPAIKLVALSMNNSDRSIIEMIKTGCCSYLLKDTHPDELEKALDAISKKGYYNGDATNIHYRRLLNTQQEESSSAITEKERVFIKLACSDMTYKEIASVMKCSERTIDGYRENLFKKLKVQSRVGLAMEAVRKDLMQL